MVDVSEKAETQREAIARGCVMMKKETLKLVLSHTNEKGDPIAVAELAGIMAAKRTSDFIPLCHPLPLTKVSVHIVPSTDQPALLISSSVKTTAKTGVEMEALMAVSTACLTLYDMLKAVDKGMVITQIELVQKTGGKSDDYYKANQ